MRSPEGSFTYELDIHVSLVCSECMRDEDREEGEMEKWRNEKGITTYAR